MMPTSIARDPTFQEMMNIANGSVVITGKDQSKHCDLLFGKEITKLNKNSDIANKVTIVATIIFTAGLIVGGTYFMKFVAKSSVDYLAWVKKGEPSPSHIPNLEEIPKGQKGTRCGDEGTGSYDTRNAAAVRYDEIEMCENFGVFFAFIGTIITVAAGGVVIPLICSAYTSYLDKKKNEIAKARFTDLTNSILNEYENGNKDLLKDLENDKNRNRLENAFSTFGIKFPLEKIFKIAEANQLHKTKVTEIQNKRATVEKELSPLEDNFESIIRHYDNQKTNFEIQINNLRKDMQSAEFSEVEVISKRISDLSKMVRVNRAEKNVFIKDIESKRLDLELFKIQEAGIIAGKTENTLDTQLLEKRVLKGQMELNLALDEQAGKKVDDLELKIDDIQNQIEVLELNIKQRDNKLKQVK